MYLLLILDRKYFQDDWISFSYPCPYRSQNFSVKHYILAFFGVVRLIQDEMLCGRLWHYSPCVLPPLSEA